MMPAAKTRARNRTATFYDRIADVHNLALKLNGYKDSVAKFLKSLNLTVTPETMVLDAGSGTGIVTLAFHKAGFRPKKTVAFDLSRNSLKLAMEQASKEKQVDAAHIEAIQGNILALPFADESFDIVLSCGVLEYVDLDDGLRETARVLKSGGKLVLLPVKPSLVGSVLEIIYNFKIHPLEDVRKISQRYFNIVGNHKFPIAEPIAWSKAIFLLEKK